MSNGDGKALKDRAKAERCQTTMFYDHSRLIVFSRGDSSFLFLRSSQTNRTCWVYPWRRRHKTCLKISPSNQSGAPAGCERCTLAPRTAGTICHTEAFNYVWLNGSCPASRMTSRLNNRTIRVLSGADGNTTWYLLNAPPKCARPARSERVCARRRALLPGMRRVVETWSVQDKTGEVLQHKFGRWQ